jgi:hypothetical protein
MSTHDPDRPEHRPPDQPEQPDDMREADVANGENPDEAGEDRQRQAKRPDPDAPGLHVDDNTSADVPEPNEPG